MFIRTCKKMAIPDSAERSDMKRFYDKVGVIEAPEGGWQVTLVYVAPLPRPSDKVAILTKTPGFCAHCPPYENSLNNERAPPNIAPKFHGYSMMRARTGRLLL